MTSTSSAAHKAPNKRASNKRQALIVISSARQLPLALPAGQSVSTGFFLVELAQILRTFEADYDFVFATPDGQPPQIDINGLSLPFHATDKLGETAFAVSQAMSKPDFSVDAYRAQYSALVQRRDEEVALALKHLGALPLSAALPSSDPEAVHYADSVRECMSTVNAKPWHALAELNTQHTDAAAAFTFADFDFAYFPGGHGPMVDFHANPHMGQTLRLLRAEGVFISLICHAPVALTATHAGLAAGESNPFAGAALTTVPKLGELFMLDYGYPKVPGQETRLPYYVDEALIAAGFKVETTENAAAVHLVWDEAHRLLTGNGPQSVDVQAARMRALLG